MKKPFINLLIIINLYLGGCASTYKSIRPESLAYMKTSQESPELTYEYRFDVLKESRNRKYYKKEIYKKTQIVALKITNNTDGDIQYNKDFQLYSGDNVLPVLPVEIVHKNLKQQAPLHLLYLALTPVKYPNTTIVKNTETFPIGFIIGPGIALYNVMKASSANTKFKNELNNHNLEGKTIKKGESFYALVGIKDISFGPISVRLTNNTTATINN